MLAVPTLVVRVTAVILVTAVVLIAMFIAITRVSVILVRGRRGATALLEFSEICLDTFDLGVVRAGQHRKAIPQVAEPVNPRLQGRTLLLALTPLVSVDTVLTAGGRILPRLTAVLVECRQVLLETLDLRIVHPRQDREALPQTSQAFDLLHQSRTLLLAVLRRIVARQLGCRRHGCRLRVGCHRVVAAASQRHDGDGRTQQTQVTTVGGYLPQHLNPTPSSCGVLSLGLL